MAVKFKHIDKLKRRPDIEGETGTHIGLPDGTTLIALAASYNNSRWRAASDDIVAELNRLKNAHAAPKKQREYVAGEYSRRIVIGWYYTDDKGDTHEGPPDEEGSFVKFSPEAVRDYLIEGDDAFEALESVIYDHTKYRGARIQAVVAEGKD